MRILLIAYEFPPSASPQSLRWAYLSRELALAGHDVHVLTIDLGGTTPGLPEIPPGVHIHRTHAGMVRGVVARRRNRRQQRARDGAGEGAGATGARSGWKHMISVFLQRIAQRIWFPDLRGEWMRTGVRALDGLLETVAPDVVISSHEPATTLQLGLRAKRQGYRWIADLGDPVLAAYTPHHWRRRAARLEADVCEHADGILVTAASAARQLEARHGRKRDVLLLTQGFDDRLPAEDRPGTGADWLDLLYTGSFYSFRRPEALIDAVRRTQGVRLSIAAVTLPDSVVRACRDEPERFRLLGFLPHASALRRQRMADVLVSIGNRDAGQVPGKVYEYLGARRPILHIRHQEDAVSQLLADTRRGDSCPDSTEAIIEKLEALRDAMRAGLLDGHYDLSPDPVAPYGWRHIASMLEHHLLALPRRMSPGSGAADVLDTR